MPGEQFGFIFARENCIQCHGCEIACKSWRNVELGVKWRRVENIWEGAYPNVRCLSASVSCMHCTEPACVAVCPGDAIQKRPGDGIVVADGEKCIGCRSCLDVCPFGVPQFGADGRMQKCDMCVSERESGAEDPPCVRTCPTRALTLMKVELEKKKEAEKSMKVLVDAARIDFETTPSGNVGG